MLKELDKYRLDEIQKQALINALDGVDGEIFLFGSRVDLNKKGGDVDILIFTDSSEQIELKWNIQNKYLMEADESIDVIVFNNNSMTNEQNIFISNINKVRIN